MVAGIYGFDRRGPNCPGSAGAGAGVSMRKKSNLMQMFRIFHSGRTPIWGQVVGFAIVSNICTTVALAAPAQLWHGLTVSRFGILEKQGRPYRGIGVNFVGALRQLLANPHDRSVAADFKELAAYHIPFVRFPALAAWGSSAHRRRYLDKVYYRHPGRYFGAMDKLCAIANHYHIGLIPSLFFTRWPDALAHEHGLAVWNNPKSLTFHIWTQYTVAMVRRYEFNPAIWGWEFGNELNLKMDLPNAAVVQILETMANPTT